MSESQAQAVERVSLDVFEQDYLGKYRPVIITGAISDWRALRLWRPDYLASVLRTKQVQVAVSAEDRFSFRPTDESFEDAARFELETIAFPSAVARICLGNSSEHIYVMQRSIPDELPELVSDFRVPKWVDTAKPTINFWFGGANNVTPLHYDQPNNCFAQVYGRKSFTLFDPMQTEFLYPFPADTSLGHLSSVDIEMPDFTKHAKFRCARPMQCVIRPGELLYLPAYWWHQVRSLEVAISVSFWWPPQFQQRLLPNALRVLPSLYKKDCLASLKSTLMASSGLSFVEVAELLSRLEIRWASVLLAGAAFEERLRQLSIARGFPEKREGLSGASSRANAMKRYSSKEVRQIEALDAAVVKALTASNNQFTDAEVASLIEGVRSLILR